MEKFINEDFILESPLAKELYKHVKDAPIIDYHSHLSAEEIYKNHRFASISEAWLGFDHYKWRQMRTMGIDEQLITGNGSDQEKFVAYAKTLDYAIGNPLIHWTHLELDKYFGISDFLTSENALEIYGRANEIIATGAVDVRNVLQKSNVKMIGTTDDILDELTWHQKIYNDSTIDVKVLPTFRPDRFINIENSDYSLIIKELSNATIDIKNLDNLKQAFKIRLDYFQSNGCKISDHGISTFHYLENTDEMAEQVFSAFLKGDTLTSQQQIIFKSNLLEFFAKEYQQRNWVMQLHIGATRNNNLNLFKQLGADIGCDAIGDSGYIEELSKYLGSLSATNSIGKTVIYNLNPSDNYAIATMVGNFQHGPTKGLLQFGSGWWFNDQRAGIESHLSAHAQLGLLRVFIGMLTDSRSFLSFTRHDYFRRILCNFVANLVNTKQYPNNPQMLYNIVDEICYKNAIDYFELGE